VRSRGEVLIHRPAGAADPPLPVVEAARDPGDVLALELETGGRPADDPFGPLVIVTVGLRTCAVPSMKNLGELE
jgi:hypothetical protein